MIDEKDEDPGTIQVALQVTATAEVIHADGTRD